VSLRNKTITGLAWTFGQQFSVQAINFIVQLVLARILGPEAFGLIAMIMVIMVIGNTLSDSGLASSLIRTKDVSEKDYSTVFILNVGFSVWIYGVIYFFAPILSSFYQETQLTDVVRLFSLSIVIRSLTIVQTTKLTKELNFRKQMIAQVPSVLIGGICGVVFAYWGFGVWSLVYMNLIQVSIFSVLIWLITNWKPTLIFDKEICKRHFLFGYKLTISALMHSLYTNLYVILIGRFYSPQQVGYYTQADNLRIFPARQTTNAVDKVTYPIFSKVQDDPEKLRSIYRSVTQQIVFWLTPLMCCLMLIAEPLFFLLLTDAWEGAILYFQILCVSAVMYPLTVYNLNILNVKGRSDLVLRIAIVKYIISIIGIFSLYSFGVIYLVWFQFIITFINFFINGYFSGKIIEYPALRQFNDIVLYYVLGIAIGLILLYCGSVLFATFSISERSWLALLIKSSFFFLLYFGLSFLFRFRPLFESYKIAKDFTNNRSDHEKNINN